MDCRKRLYILTPSGSPSHVHVACGDPGEVVESGVTQNHKHRIRIHKDGFAEQLPDDTGHIHVVVAKENSYPNPKNSSVDGFVPQVPTHRQSSEPIYYDQNVPNTQNALQNDSKIWWITGLLLAGVVFWYIFKRKKSHKTSPRNKRAKIRQQEEPSFIAVDYSDGSNSTSVKPRQFTAADEASIQSMLDG
jgi:hypothetical protein